MFTCYSGSDKCYRLNTHAFLVQGQFTAVQTWWPSEVEPFYAVYAVVVNSLAKISARRELLSGARDTDGHQCGTKKEDKIFGAFRLDQFLQIDFLGKVLDSLLACETEVIWHARLVVLGRVGSTHRYGDFLAFWLLCLVE